MALRLEPMTPKRYTSWVPETITGFIAQQVASGAMPEPGAREYADREFDRLLPEGLLTPGHHVWSAYDEDVEVGYLWLAVLDQSEATEGHVLDVAVRPDLRRRGYGRALLLATEDEARVLGVTAMRLNVFGHNVAAERLYRGLGYETASTQMARRLDGPRPPTLEGGPALRLEPITREQFDTAQHLTAQHLTAQHLTAQHLTAQHLTAQHFTWTAYDGQRAVGLIWLHITRRSDGLHAFGHVLAVTEDLSRHGYGRAIIAAAEQICDDRAVVSVRLNVSGPTDGARSLCEQMGYALTATLLTKALR